MKTYILLLLMTLSLSGCSAWGIAKNIISPSDGIQAEVRVAAEANDQVIVGDQKDQDIKGEVVEVNNVETVTNVLDTSPLMLVLLVLGWLLPSPSEIWRGFLNSINFLIRGKK